MQSQRNEMPSKPPGTVTFIGAPSRTTSTGTPACPSVCATAWRSAAGLVIGRMFARRKPDE